MLVALVDAAHEAGLQVLAHAHSLAGIRHAVIAGPVVDGIEHFAGLAPAGLDLPGDLLDEVASARIQVCPTAGGATPRGPHRTTSSRQGLRGAFDAMGYTFPTFLDARREHFGRMRQHGITVVSGTDAGIGPAKAHGGVRFAIADLVGAGWPIPEVSPPPRPVRRRRAG